ncbi:M15 family metallopeptidase [Alkaliphilus transvaalensis]|uniref:M15 family metallopeptidase n=1 Tax=Alkaliphilus transvaalensis TaxID=114628 RepID=UPI00146FC199|nr:M15 family metallopeptidase [Alkaliphilus transvaalensis]
MRKITEKTYVTLDVDYLTILKQDLFSLMMAYPHDIVDIEIENKHTVYLILKSGEKLLYDDLKNKTETEKLQNPDLQDMMSELYLLGPVNGLMPENYNPGRIRVYPLLKEVYGANQVEIEKNLTGIRVNSSYHRFNSNNSASLHLNQALDELTHLLKDAPHLWSYLHPIGGTYNFRYISNTNRLSPHSFGISIDLAIHKDDYWQWTSRKAGEKRLMSYPQEIVDVMEKHYFIWGGKWGLFDTLHFEYRPEIIIKGKYFNSQPQTLWYEKLPVKEEKVTNIILLIEERLKGFIVLFSFHL